MAQIGFYLIGIGVLFILLKLISLPMRIIGRLVINSILGFALIFVLGFFGITLALTWWGYLIIGLFGIPGVIFIVLFSMFLL
ncbi:MAG: pro-sigmaK processing inhibitor BofA family protein [Clostridia bacterium]|nr:pro-sigmaK processing inhibitor BofA family protein [Clostridia bacterium]